MSRMNGSHKDVEIRRYQVVVSGRFLAISYVGCVLLALAVGRLARETILTQSAARLREFLAEHVKRSEAASTPPEGLLPPPVAKGKRAPHTIYTAKNFDTARTATSSSLLIRRDEDNNLCLEGGDETCFPMDNDEVHNGTDDADEEEHLPAGQHLLVDMKGIDASFLNSEERLARAMIEVVNEASLTLLSYHCHRMVPEGVSCVGVLLESHVSFHTWPAEGVITLDLFTCGAGPLVPVVPSIERLFGVPLRGTNEPPQVLWSHKLRGFRPKDRRNALQQADLGHGFLGLMVLDYKKEVSDLLQSWGRKNHLRLFNTHSRLHP